MILNRILWIKYNFNSEWFLMILNSLQKHIMEMKWVPWYGRLLCNSCYWIVQRYYMIWNSRNQWKWNEVITVIPIDSIDSYECHTMDLNQVKANFYGSKYQITYNGKLIRRIPWISNPFHGITLITPLHFHCDYSVTVYIM